VKIVCSHHVEQHDGVDVAVLARLAPSTAPLEADEDDTVAKYCLKFSGEYLRPNICIHENLNSLMT